MLSFCSSLPSEKVSLLSGTFKVTSVFPVRTQRCFNVYPTFGRRRFNVKMPLCAYWLSFLLDYPNICVIVLTSRHHHNRDQFHRRTQSTVWFWVDQPFDIATTRNGMNRPRCCFFECGSRICLVRSPGNQKPKINKLLKIISYTIFIKLVYFFGRTLKCLIK